MQVCPSCLGLSDKVTGCIEGTAGERPLSRPLTEVRFNVVPRPVEIGKDFPFCMTGKEML